MAEEYQTFGIRLPVAEIEFLDKVAERNHVARVTVVRWAIDNYRTSKASLFLPECATDNTIELPVEQPA